MKTISKLMKNAHYTQKQTKETKCKKEFSEWYLLWNSKSKNKIQNLLKKRFKIILASFFKGFFIWCPFYFYLLYKLHTEVPRFYISQGFFSCTQNFKLLMQPFTPLRLAWFSPEDVPFSSVSSHVYNTH